MSGKNNIDQLVSDTFAEQQLSVNQAHWASTQSFILLQKRRRRRLVAFWLLGILLMSTAGYLTFYTLLKDTAPAFTEGTPSEPHTTEAQNSPTNMGSQPTTDELLKHDSLAKTEFFTDSNGRYIDPNNGLTKNLQVDVMAHLSVDSTTQAYPTSLLNPSLDPEKPKAQDSSKMEFSMSLSMHLGLNKDSTDNQEKEQPEETPTKSSSFAEASTTFSVETVNGTEPVVDPPKTDVASSLGLIENNADSSRKEVVTKQTALQDEPQSETEGVDTTKRQAVTLIDSLTPKAQVNIIPSIDSLPFDSTLALTLDSNEHLSALNDTSLLVWDSLTAPKKLHFTGYFIMPYLGPSLSFRNLSGANDALQEKREKEENKALTLDLGLTARFGLSNRMYIGTGFNYYKMGENAEYSAFETVNQRQEAFDIITIKETDYWEYTDWDTAFLPFEQKVYTGYRWVEQRDTLRTPSERTVFDTIATPAQAVNNRFTYLEIPLLIGYEIPLGKWSLGGDMGTGLNFLIGTQGAYPNMEEGSYNSLIRSNYRMLSYTFISNLSLGHQLSPHWSMYGNIRFRNQLSTAQKANDAIKARYRSTGFQFKLNYTF